MESRKISERYNLLKKRDEVSTEIKKANTKMATLLQQHEEYKSLIFYKNSEHEQQQQNNKLFREFNDLAQRKNELEYQLFDIDNQLFK